MLSGAPLLGQPATVLLPNGGDQTAGVFVAAQIDQLEVMQQTGLQLDEMEAPAQGLQDWQAVALKAARVASRMGSSAVLG